MIGSIDDPRVLARIGNACGEAAEHIRHRLTTAAHKEAEGQSGTREEAATEDLADAIDAIDALGEALVRTTERMLAELVTTGRPKNQAVTVRKCPPSKAGGAWHKAGTDRRDIERGPGRRL